MENTPPRPNFPIGCTYSLLILAGIFIIAIIVNNFTKKKDPKDPSKNVSNKYVASILGISILLFIIVSVSCGWWYSFKRREWVYRYGSSFEKSVQLASDVLDIVE